MGGGSHGKLGSPLGNYDHKKPSSAAWSGLRPIRMHTHTTNEKRVTFQRPWPCLCLPLALFMLALALFSLALATFIAAVFLLIFTPGPVYFSSGPV